MIRPLLLCGLVLAFLSAPASANDEARLKELQAEIAKLEQWLNSAKDEFSDLNAKLRKSDEEIAAISKQIQETRRQLAEEKDRLKKLRQEQGQLRELRQQHRNHLAEQLRAAQKLGNEGPVKLLLNQDDPQLAQRMMRYFGYFNTARIERIQHIIAELTRLDQIAELISESERKLQVSEQNLIAENKRLAQGKKDQQQLLASLQSRMNSEQKRLAQKQADRKRLESLLNEVQTLLETSPRKNDARPFRALKGKLPMPVDGRIRYAFGNRTSDGKSRWEGWMMSANEGAPVRAVHHGRVVYSDWLRGFGLLTILDHGDGYLSLYAHNQALMNSVGQWVNQGETIATAGRSGGLDQAGLYFEIRYKGQPQDPAAWIKR